MLAANLRISRNVVNGILWLTFFCALVHLDKSTFNMLYSMFCVFLRPIDYFSDFLQIKL